MGDHTTVTRAGSFRVGIDTGGTFTDLVLLEEATGERRTFKVPSTPWRPADAAFEALRRSGAQPEEIVFFILGTTIAVNAVLQRQGQRTVYVTTGGFEDVPFIQRINRLGLYDLQWVKAVPYVRRPDCLGVRERVAYDGSVRTPLEDGEIERVVGELARRDAGEAGGIAVALCLLFSFVNPEHERRLAGAVRAALPGVPLSVSSEVAPIWREYERANTVIVDASLRKLVRTFAEELDRGLGERGLTCPRFLLKSNGGQVAVHAAAEKPVNLILSGLAGGLIAGKHFADGVGRSDVITLDMGGTSADVGVVAGGRIRQNSQHEFEWGLPIAVPVVDLTTIGAGGSSVAGFDQGGFLKVGPESAAADPGPAAYGKGGERATVTDANLVLGRLNPRNFLGGELELHPARAAAAIEPIAAQLGLGLEEAAQAIVEMATENMANAVRLLCAGRGLDYRRFDLLAFGGAGPLHASLTARRVGLPAVIVPPSPGLASAFGTLVADGRVDRRITRLLRSDLTRAEELGAALEQLGREALAELRLEGDVLEPVLVLGASCRYLGQNFEQDVTLALDGPGDLVALAVERFHGAHELVYGYRIEEAVVEIVYLTATAIEPRPVPPALAVPPRGPAEPVELRQVFWKDGGWTETPVYDRADFGPGTELHGPAIVEEVDSTTLVLTGQELRVHPTGALLLEEAAPGPEIGAGLRSGAIRG